jgi:hypothetical protein
MAPAIMTQRSGRVRGLFDGAIYDRGPPMYRARRAAGKGPGPFIEVWLYRPGKPVRW